MVFIVILRSSMSEKSFPFSTLFICRNSQKSGGVKSGVCGRWSTVDMPFRAKSCDTWREECATTLLWWRINDWSFHRSHCLHFMTSIRLFSDPFEYKFKLDDTPAIKNAYHHFNCALWYPCLLWHGDSPQTIFNLSIVSLHDFCSLTQKFTHSLTDPFHFHVWTKLMIQSDLLSYCSTNTEWSLSRHSM
jgi:hypothetical protein